MAQKLQESADMCIVLETGRSLYKLHFQLVLLLEAANKMYSVLTTTAQDNRVSFLFNNNTTKLTLVIKKHNLFISLIIIRDQRLYTRS